MGCHELRRLSFRTSTGETVRLHDCICWRHLEGRACGTAQDCQIAQSIDIVIIPVPPSGYSNSKRARKCTPTQAASPTTSPAAPSAATPKTGADSPRSGTATAASASVDHDALLRWCAAAREALEAGGLRVTVDDCPRQTPGAKYHTWEHRGVALRVEVGVREVATGTTCLALHPRLAHMMPLAARTTGPTPSDHAGALEGTAPGSPHGGISTPAVAAAAAVGGNGGGRGGRASLRLVGLSLGLLVAACRAVVAAGRSSQVGGTGSSTTASTAAAAAPAGAPPVTSGCSSSGSSDTMKMAAAAGALPGAVRSQWCSKLHLWPELVAEWGNTEAAVAAMLAELIAAAATATAAQQADCGGSGDTGAAGDGRPGAAEPSPGQRPCVAHLRHLLQLGRPCYCGRGHYSLLQLQHEVEQRFGESSHHQQQHHQQQHHQQVLTWIVPSSLPPSHARSGRPPKGVGLATGGRERHQQLQQRCKPEQKTARRQTTHAHGAHEQQDVKIPTLSEDGRHVPETTVVDGACCGPSVTAAAAVAVTELGDSDFDRRSDSSDDCDNDDGGGGGGENRIILLVGNIPPAVKATAVQAALSAAFAPYGCCGVAVSRTRQGGTHSWARVSLATTSSSSSSSPSAADAAVVALDGKLHLGGAALTVSYSSGRLDTIFPYLPYVVRSALRVDSTAAFSATDQATADKMTELLAGLAERLLLPSPTPMLLPLTLTDGTACCGGNTLSFARRFQRVVAVELDPDRAADLRHNIALVQAWDAFRRGQQPAAATKASSVATEANGSPSDEPPRPLPGISGSATTPPGAVAGGPLPFLPLGSIEVVCGDYTQVAKSLRQDVVFLDPPWGGPQYGNSSNNCAPVSASKTSGRAVAGGAGVGDGRDIGMEYGDTAFMLGQEPLSYLVTELLVGGGAGMVALKLPSRLCGELRSMQWRVRQLVAARLRGGGVDSGTAGGAAAACNPNDGDGAHAGTPRDSRRLRGVEVTLGRSALVVFLLVPYNRKRLVNEDGGELRTSNCGACAGMAGAIANAEAAWGPGACATGTDGRVLLALQPEEAHNDNGEAAAGRDDSEEAQVGRSARNRGDGGGGDAGRRTQRPVGPDAEGRTARPGSVPTFRTNLRYLCSGLELPYRLLYE